MQTIAQIVCIWLLLYSLSIHSSFYLIFVLSRGNFRMDYLDMSHIEGEER